LAFQQERFQFRTAVRWKEFAHIRSKGIELDRLGKYEYLRLNAFPPKDAYPVILVLADRLEYPSR
jgi:hypothetical protein